MPEIKPRLNKRTKFVAGTLTTLLACGTVVGFSAMSASAASWSDQANTSASELPLRDSAYSNKGIRVKDGINPPTNSWISGAVFVGDGTYKPTFTGSISFKSAADSFGVFSPNIVATPKTVFGMYSDDNQIKFAPEGASGYQLTRIDDLSADLTYKKGSQDLGTLTSAEGWVYVQYKAATAQNLKVTAPSAITAIDGGYTFKDGNGTTYRVITPGKLTGGTLALGAGQTVHTYAVPKNATAADIKTLDAGAVELQSATTAYAVADGKATTDFTLKTKDNKPTVFASMPHQDGISSDSKLGGTYENIQGTQKLLAGNKFSYGITALSTPLDLDLSEMTDDQKATLKAQIKKDIPTVTKFDAEGSYYGGKYLERAVQVYRLAKQLDMKTETATLKTAIVAELDMWMDPDRCETESTKCFTYDNLFKGVVGQKAEYGSDTEFNDHYFHYGYFLYAAGAMALDDPSLVSKYKTVADLLAADIANTKDTATAIERRNFDDYAGHSWASGVSPFQDGNNQESTSEATNAWIGLNLWATASGNQELADEAIWMFSNEARTAVQYYLDPKKRAGFTSPQLSMVWGGKADYATWFSGSASAITGIQVIPVAPAHIAYLKSVGDEQLDVLSDSVFGVNNDNVSGQPLVDWDVALTAMNDTKRAELLYSKLQDSDIDNGNTRSYLYALIHSAGTVESAPTIPADPNEPEPVEPTTPPVTTPPVTPPVTEPTTPPVVTPPTTNPGAPKVIGELVDSVDGDHTATSGSAVTQKLSYTGFSAGNDYTIVTELWDAKTNLPIAGTVKDKVFNAKTDSGDVTLNVPYVAALDGKTVVAKTRLLGPGGVLYGNFDSVTDSKQIVTFGGGSTAPTVPTTPPVVTPPVVTPPVTEPTTPPVTTPAPTVPAGDPKYISELTDKDGDHSAKNNTDLTQTIKYDNLKVGQDYVVVVELLDAKTKAGTGVVVDKVFRPTATSGTVTLTIKANTTLNNKSVIANARLLGPAGAVFTNVTTDLDDKQTVKFS